MKTYSEAHYTAISKVRNQSLISHKERMKTNVFRISFKSNIKMTFMSSSNMNTIQKEKMNES